MIATVAEDVVCHLKKKLNLEKKLELDIIIINNTKLWRFFRGYTVSTSETFLLPSEWQLCRLSVCAGWEQ